MKTYEEWLEEFRTKIKEGYETHRMDKRLAGYTYEVDKPAKRLWKYDEPIRAQSMPEGGTIITMPTPKIREVKPYQVGYKLNIRKWTEDPVRVVGMDNFMYRIGVNVAEREVWVMAKGMSDNAEHVIEAEKKGELSKNDIKKARDWISSQGMYADTIIMHSKQRWRFLRNGELWESYRIPTGYVPERDRGPYYAGKIDGANVYSTLMIKDFALVYRKKEILVKNTQLKIDYDNPKRPSTLIVNKWCSSAPIIEQAVVKIVL